MKKIILAFSLIIGVASCSSVPSLSSKNIDKTASLSNSQWVMEGGNVSQSSKITMDIEKGKVSGFSGCNNYFGQLITSESGEFVVRNLGVTRLSCDRGLGIEKNFLDVLEKVNKYSVKGSVLYLYRDNILLLKLDKK